MIQLGREIMDCIKPFQEEMLAVSYPLAGNSCLVIAGDFLPSLFLFLLTFYPTYHYIRSLSFSYPSSKTRTELKDHIGGTTRQQGYLLIIVSIKVKHVV